MYVCMYVYMYVFIYIYVYMYNIHSYRQFIHYEYVCIDVYGTYSLKIPLPFGDLRLPTLKLIMGLGSLKKIGNLGTENNC